MKINYFNAYFKDMSAPSRIQGPVLVITVWNPGKLCWAQLNWLFRHASCCLTIVFIRMSNFGAEAGFSQIFWEFQPHMFLNISFSRWEIFKIPPYCKQIPNRFPLTLYKLLSRSCAVSISPSFGEGTGFTNLMGSCGPDKTLCMIMKILYKGKEVYLFRKPWHS